MHHCHWPLRESLFRLTTIGGKSIHLKDNSESLSTSPCSQIAVVRPGPLTMGNASTGGCFQHDEEAAGIEVRIYYISLSQGQEQEPLVSVLDSRVSASPYLFSF